MNRYDLALATLLASLIVGCGGESAAGNGGTGGGSSVIYGTGGFGGSTGTSVTTSLAGTPGAGGTPSSGGSQAIGGMAPTGGVAATGGTTSANCNALVNNAPAVTVVAIPEPVPTPVGGTIVDGTYQLTDFREYTGAGGTTTPSLSLTASYVLDVSSCTAGGCVFQMIAHLALSGISVTEEGNGVMTTSGTSYSTSFTCSTGSASGDTGYYTATAGAILLFSTATSTTSQSVGVFTRQ